MSTHLGIQTAIVWSNDVCREAGQAGLRSRNGIVGHYSADPADDLSMAGFLPTTRLQNNYIGAVPNLPLIARARKPFSGRLCPVDDWQTDEEVNRLKDSFLWVLYL